ncbi:nucleoside phosphatase family-domain-containing protein [Absidia repens]|uniref:Nucleoside phosphatase family-domain-containing protein n=1 Tax=Absidia repens TaxID=90262 RepID=A0A1X2IF59_9FUNG|nr:nucleoside phosphatase family-domain-containing protein [Absidia repens]
MASHVKSLKRQPFTPSTDEDWETNRQYGVIIDAGSSGSRVYIYSWKDHDYLKSTYSMEDLKGNIPIVERADKNGLKWTHRQEPGISTFGPKPDEVEVVPVQQQSSTPVFLMATAGVRLLPMGEQTALMDTTYFVINDCGTHIQTIPGELEGVYGWVAVNYLMGGFDSSAQLQFPSSSLGQQKKQQHTFGFLDMGGASAQIAFEPDHHQKEEHVADLTKIHLRTLDGSPMDYDVFVTTFLGYGSNEARRRYLEQRVKILFDNQKQQQQHDGDGTMTSGTSGRQGLLDQYHRLPLDDPCLPLHLELTDADTTSVPLQLTGTGQFAACLEATLPLLNKDAECPTKPCLFNGVHTPSIDWSVHQFVGISEYWYTSHDVLGLGGVYDFTEYEQKATAFCGKDWARELQEHPDWDAIEIQRYQLQCFKSAWMVNVLHSGIEVPRHVDATSDSGAGHLDNVPSDTTAKWMEQSIESVEHKNWNPPFRSIDTINDIQVSWTLGAMLLHVANQIPLVNQGADGSHGHSSDDEQPHSIADGVELPSVDAEHHHHEIIPGKDTWRSIPEDGSDVSAASWWDLGNTVSVIGLLMMLIILFGVVIMEWHRHSKKRRRSLGGLGLGDYRRVDMNGGILGNAPGNGTPSLSTATPSLSSSLLSLLASPIMAFEQITARPMIVLRYWTSRFLSRRGGGSNNNIINNNINNNDTLLGTPDYSIYPVRAPSNTELDSLDMSGQYDQDSVSIAMYQQQLQQHQHSQLQQQNCLQSVHSSPQLQQYIATTPNGNLGPCNKSSSMISMKYWHKKRYSGDSQRIAQMMHPSSSSSNCDHGGATSAIGYANRSNSSSNLVARTGSPLLSNDGVQISSSPSVSMTRSRSRVGFAMHETSEGGDCLAADQNGDGGIGSAGLPSNDLYRFATTSLSRTPSPSQAAALHMTKKRNNDSPRSSLDKA